MWLLLIAYSKPLTQLLQFNRIWSLILILYFISAFTTLSEHFTMHNAHCTIYNVQCTNSFITNTSSSVVRFKVTWYFREIMRNWCVGCQVVVITSTLCRCLFLSTILPFIAIDIPAELLPLLRELLWQMALQQTWLMPLTWIFQFFVITILIKGQQLNN